MSTFGKRIIAALESLCDDVLDGKPIKQVKIRVVKVKGGTVASRLVVTEAIKREQ